MKRFIPGCVLSASLAVAGGGHAEVVLNGSGQPLTGNIDITSNMGVTHGTNLFHSFSVFNVQNNENVVFSGPNAIHNVISRVTGGTSSLIDGPVSLAIPGANFYFINPNGVIFGGGGSIKATGSVYVSTADVVRLADGSSFYADPAQNSVLTTADPVAFGFLSASPASITLNGSVIYAPVPLGETFALVGGNIDLQAGAGAAIVAPGATVSLASVASSGDVGLAGLSTGEVDLSRFPTLGQIRFSDASAIDVSDWDTGTGAGSIYIRGGQLSLSGSALLAMTSADVDGGVIDIAVRGDLAAEGSSAILTGSYGGPGKGAGINLDVGGTLRVSDGSYVLSETLGSGPAGDIHIIRAGAIEVRGRGQGDRSTFISAQNSGDGAGPNLTIDDVGSLQILNSGLVGTQNSGTGTGGNLSITADSVLATGTGDVTLSLGTETTGGDAGKLTLNTHTLELRDGARISSSTAGFGAAGEVTIEATERISVSGELSGIFSQTNAPDAGDAGALNITTPLLQVDGGLIDSITVGNGDAGTVSVNVGDLQLTGGAQIRSFSGGFHPTTGALVAGNGAAGSVSVDATGSVTASGSGFGRPSGLLAETRGDGAGGEVSVSANSLSLADGATISSSSLGAGVAGDINITLGDSLTLRGASIATQATTSDGGIITITAPRLIHLVDSRITTSVQSGVGEGGNIFIDPQFVVLQNSQIIANAFGGPGGNINIIAGQLLADPATVISASSALGIDGTVNIDAPDSDVSAELAVLPDSFLDAASLMQAGCGAARAGLSSLVEVGRGGLPSDPDGYLASLDVDAMAGTGGAGAARPNQMGSAILDRSAPQLLAFAAPSDCRR
ncbi:two-partner secretion domain-containing protein [Thiobacillus sp.]